MYTVNSGDRHLKPRPQFVADLVLLTNNLSSTFFRSFNTSSQIESSTSDSLPFRQQFGQSVEIRPKFLQLQFCKKCDGHSARKNIVAPVHGAEAEATASCHRGMLHVLQKV
jgi:hypothetical protein